MIREADIAVIMGRPVGDDLVCRRLADIEMGFFCSSDYLQRRGEALFAGEGAGLDVIDYAAEELDLGSWLKARWPDARTVLKTDDVHVCLEALRMGLGISAFPGPMGESIGGLVRLDGRDLPCVEVWRVTHRDVRELARVKATAAFLDGIFEDRWTSGGEVLSVSLHPPIADTPPLRVTPPTMR